MLWLRQAAALAALPGFRCQGPHTRTGGRLDSLFSKHPSPSISAAFLSAGMVFTPETALPASALQIFKSRKQIQNQHRRVSQQRRVDELYGIVWAVDA